MQARSGNVVTTDVMTSDTVHEDQHEVDEDAGSRRTEQVRIVGAERAGDSAGPPIDGGTDAGGADLGAGTDEGWGPEDWPVPEEPQLPHWTEAPTGEIPAVLSRRDEAGQQDPWASLPEPSWREERRDWEHDETLGASLLGLAGDEPTLIKESAEEERQPWSFDLDAPEAPVSHPGAGEPDSFATLPTDELPGVRGSGDEPRDAVDDAAGAGQKDAGGDADGDPEGALEALAEGAVEELTWGAVEELAWGDAEELARGGAGEEAEKAELDFSGEETTLLSPQAPAAVRAGDDDGAEPGDMRLEGRGAADDRTRREEDARRSRGHPTRGPSDRRTVPLPPAVGDRPLAQRAPVPRHAGDDALSQRAGRNIPAAVASGLVIGGLALLAFHFGPVPSMVVVTVVLAAAAIEAYAAFRRVYRPASLLGIAAVVGLLVGTYDKPFVALPAVVVLLVAATFVWHLLGVDRRADPVRSTAATLFVFCWVGVFGSYAALLLAPSLFPHRTGIAYLLGALIAAVAYDVGALAAGAWIGRHPLSAVSPGKTWEGLLGGAVAAIVFAVGIVHLVHPWTLGQAALLGVVVAVVSPIGDLCESLVKRHLGLKDMGRILPGHGGLLDRVDGLLFVLPATYYLVRAFGHG